MPDEPEADDEDARGLSFEEKVTQIAHHAIDVSKEAVNGLIEYK